MSLQTVASAAPAIPAGRIGVTLPAPGPAPWTVASIFGPVAADLAEVDRRIVKQLQSRYEDLAAVLAHGSQLGGKRMRPALVMLAGRAIAGRRVEQDPALRDRLLTMATVVELVHTATLIHDDLLDHAETRRKFPTVHARWNGDTALLLGDYLFAQSFSLAATLPSTRACRWVGEAARKVCEGELRQILRRDVVDLDEATYIDLLRGKTGELTRVACQLGADLAGGNGQSVESLGEYGDRLGIAFQIADDAMDLWGDEEKIGKTLGTDLLQGKVTMPVLRLLQHPDRGVAQSARSVMLGPPADRLAGLWPLLRDTDAADYTAAAAAVQGRRAAAALKSIPASGSKSSLRRLIDFAIERQF